MVGHRAKGSTVVLDDVWRGAVGRWSIQKGQKKVSGAAPAFNDKQAKAGFELLENDLGRGLEGGAAAGY